MQRSYVGKKPEAGPKRQELLESFPHILYASAPKTGPKMFPNNPMTERTAHSRETEISFKSDSSLGSLANDLEHDSAGDSDDSSNINYDGRYCMLSACVFILFDLAESVGMCKSSGGRSESIVVGTGNAGNDNSAEIIAWPDECQDYAQFMRKAKSGCVENPK